MQELQAGHNRPIDGHQITVGVTGEPHDDFTSRTQIGALLLDSNGQARDLADLISAEMRSLPCTSRM